MYSNSKKYLKLYSNCILCNGFSRSIICDLQYEKYDYIPNDLYEILNKYTHLTIHDVFKKYGNKNRINIELYYDFIIKNEYGFLSEENIEIPNILANSNVKENFTNAIIEIGPASSLEIFNSSIDIIESLGIWAIQIIIREEASIIEYCIHRFSDTSIKHIEFIMNKNTYLTHKHLLSCKQLRKLSIYACNPEDTFKSNTYKIVLYKELISKAHHNCANINLHKFKINISFYKEYISGNTCLLGKLCITENGSIKRCLYSNQTFGNVKDKNKLSFLNTPNFKEIAFIKKGQIDKCKDCEHRIMCMDCRSFIKKKEDLYSSPAYCSYNPYTAKWE